MTVELLRYANREAIAQAMTEAGYSVTRQTVNRWAKGDQMPTIAERMILHLFGHDPDEPVIPSWIERLLAGTMALEDKARVSDEELAEAEARAAIYLAAGTRRRRGPVGGGGAAGGAA